MEVKIEPSWKVALQAEFQAPYFKLLTTFVKEEYNKYCCYPPADKIFAAFNRTPLKKVKVVILGQDPYHGFGQANGLCFSVAKGVANPPSLTNIFKELQTDVNKPYPEHGDLTAWADQGVLLLNATLSVREATAGSHQKKGWEAFTDAAIKTVSDQQKEVVFMLWGGYAKKKVKLIDATKHLILESGHPSPLSANRGYWFGNSHFSKANAYLKSVGKSEIVW